MPDLMTADELTRIRVNLVPPSIYQDVEEISRLLAAYEEVVKERDELIVAYNDLEVSLKMMDDDRSEAS